MKELEDTLTKKELAEWIVFSRLFPFGEDAEDIRTAMVSATVANSSPNRKKGRSYKLKNFLPFRRQYPQRPKTKEDLVNSIFAAFKIRR